MPVNSVKLNMRQNAAKFVPRLLTNDQKQHQLEISTELKQQVRNDQHFLFKVVTGDESWQNGNHPSGTVHPHPRQRKCSKWRAMWSQCQSAFSTLTGLSIRNLSLQFRPSMLSSTVMSWGDLKRTQGGSDQTNGVWTSVCSITMRLHTPLWLCSSLASKNMMIIPHPPYSPATSCSSPKWKSSWSGKYLTLQRRLKPNCRRCWRWWHKRSSRTALIMAEMFGSLHTLLRGLLWRGW